MTIRIPIATRLLLAFAAVIVIYGGAVALSIVRLGDFKATVHSITAGDLPKQKTANEWIIRLLQTARHTSNMLILEDPDKVKEELAAVQQDTAMGKQYMDELTASATLPEERAALKEVVDARNVYMTLEGAYLSLVGAGLIPSAKRVLLVEAGPAQAEYIDKLAKFVDIERALVKTRADGIDPEYERTKTLLLLLSLAAAALAGIVALLSAWQLRRQLGGEPADVAAVANKVALGDFSSRIALRPGDKTSLFANIAKMQKSLQERSEQDRQRAAEERVLAAENSRIRNALDQVSVAAMLADTEGKIIYLNNAMQRLISCQGSEMRKDLPQLDLERLLGCSLDVFRQVPVFQRALLEGLTDAHTAEFKMGGAILRIVANPVLDGRETRIGTIVQWFDRTQEAAIEEEVQMTVSSVIEGNLTVRISEEGNEGFFKNLAAGMNRMVGNMAQVLREIVTAAAEVSAGAEEISRGNSDLSQRTEQQSASLEETSSSMEQMTAAVKNSADNAAQANTLACAARDQAEQGGSVVQSAITAMSEINSSSKKIADIIGVIDGIAFQTNLLALNAAVEAARAGEQGRGFAVVASEVRNLASRCAAAAKEIKGLIQESVVKVDDGTKLVAASGKVLQDIVAGVKKVTNVVAEIAASSKEQASGIDQVNKAIMSMDEVTQQNAALVEEAAAAAQSLTEQAANLAQLMARFEVREESAETALAGSPLTKHRSPPPWWSRPGVGLELKRATQ
ncbi:MAG: methyl-accepting chemotaxis protein [Steroidobacteraceae bacterium]|jgi:methyl-accepting chemotaxis protein